MGRVKAPTKRKPVVRLDDSKSKLNASTKKEKKNPKADQEQGSDYFDHRTGAVYSTRPEDTDVKLVEAKITNFLKELGELSHPDQELEEYTTAPQGYLPVNHPKHNQTPPSSSTQATGKMESAITITTTTTDTPITFWQEVRDPKTNRTYYWNPRTSEVTWTLPDNAVITSEAAESKMPVDPELEDEQNTLQNSLTEAYALYAKPYYGVDHADKQQEANGVTSQTSSGESDRGSSGEKSSAQRKTKGKKQSLIGETSSPQDSPVRSKKPAALSTPGSAKVGKTEPQMLRLQVSSASDEFSRKLNFLHVSDDGLTQVQKFSIILETRLSDWKEGVLSSKYMLAKLKEMEDMLQEYVESATPTGWVCSWDSATCRYYYNNDCTGDISWGYPSQSVTSPMSSQDETDPGSVEVETRESNGDEPAAAEQEMETDSIDSGVDEKVDKQPLVAPPPPPSPPPLMSNQPASSTQEVQEISVPAPTDDTHNVQVPLPQAVVDAGGLVYNQSIFSSQDSQVVSSVCMSPPDNTEATPDKVHREMEGQEAMDQPDGPEHTNYQEEESSAQKTKEDLYAFLPEPVTNKTESKLEHQPPPELLDTAKEALYPPTASPTELGVSHEANVGDYNLVSREDIGMSADDEETRLRQKLLRRLKPSSVTIGSEPQAEAVEPVHGDETEPVHGDETEPVHGDETEPVHGDETEPVHGDETEPASKSTDKETGQVVAMDKSAAFLADAEPDNQEKSVFETEDTERPGEDSVVQDSTTAPNEEPESEMSPVTAPLPVANSRESKDPVKPKKRARDISDQSDSDTSRTRQRKSYLKKSRYQYDSDHSDYSADDSRRRRSSRRHRSRSRSYDYYSDKDRHRSSRHHRSVSSDDSYSHRDSRRSSRRYDRYSDEYSDDDDRRSYHRSSRKHRSGSRSADRKDSKNRKDKKKKKDKKKHRHDDDDRFRSSDKRHSKSSSSTTSSRFKDKKPKDSPKPLPPPPEKTFVPAKFKPRGKVREEREESPPTSQPVAVPQGALTPQQMEMVQNIATATGAYALPVMDTQYVAYGYPVPDQPTYSTDMAADTSTATYVPPSQSLLVESMPDQQPPVTAEPQPEASVAGEPVKPLAQAPCTAEEQPIAAPATSEPTVIEMQEPEEVDMDIEEAPSPARDQEDKENQTVADDEAKALEAYKASVIDSLAGAQKTTEKIVDSQQTQKEETQNEGEKLSSQAEVDETVVREEGKAWKTNQSQEDEPLPPGTLSLVSKSSSPGPPGEVTATGRPQQDDDYKMPSDDEGTPPASATTATTTIITTSSNEGKKSPVIPSSSSTTNTTPSSAKPASIISPVITTTTMAARDSTPPLPPVTVSAITTSSVATTSVGYSYSSPATSYNYQNDPAQQQAYAAVYAQSMYNPATSGTYYPYQYNSGTYDPNYAAAMNYYASAYQAAYNYNASAYQAYYQNQSGSGSSNQKK